MSRTLLEDDLDAVVGRGSGRCWKRIRMQLLEVEEDPDIAGRGFGCSCWKWIRTLLEEDPDTVAGSGRGFGRCWKRIQIQLLEVEEDL